MAYTGELTCVRCGRTYEDPALPLIGAGCPSCADNGVPANVLPSYDLGGMREVPTDATQPGLFRYRDLLPLAPGSTAVSLAEGHTPVLDLPGLADQVGAETVVIKDESRNPTWSYKDRLAAVATAKALEVGADTVVVSSTGNHGAAIAAYAAAAGLRCVVLTVASAPATMKTLMQAYGAHVVALERHGDRWTLMRQLVADYGWMPMSGFVDPPAGSNPFGVDGYKTIAYELAEQLPRVPDVVVVPVAYGDGFVGIARGFADLVALGVIEHMPRMVAAEPFGPLASAMAEGSADGGTAGRSVGPVPVRPSVAFSTASPFGTQQSLWALRASGGTAVATPEDETIMAVQRQLAAEHGLYLEASSVTPVVALTALAERGEVAADESVALIGTSTGLKDVGTTAARLPEVPVIEPTVSALESTLEAPS